MTCFYETPTQLRSRRHFEKKTPSSPRERVGNPNLAWKSKDSELRLLCTLQLKILLDGREDDRVAGTRIDKAG
jgi:hypothetical protein